MVMATAWATPCCCRLHSAWPDAQAWLEPVDFAWIESEVRHIVGVFAAFAKLRARPRYRCPDCREQMHLSDGDWLTCAVDCPVNLNPML